MNQDLRTALAAAAAAAVAAVADVPVPGAAAVVAPLSTPTMYATACGNKET